MVEDTKQVVAQCTVEVAVIQVELGDFHTKISTPEEWLKGDSRGCVGGLLGMGSPKDSFVANIPCFESIL